MEFDNDMLPYAKSLATRIHHTRKAKHMTLADVARLADIRVATVWQAEHNPSNMKLSTIDRVLTPLGLSVTTKRTPR